MQAQQFSVHLHRHYYPFLQNMQPHNTSEPYSSMQCDVDCGGFSRGSSLAQPHEDYRYFPDRGGTSPRPSSLSLAGNSLNATGMAITGNGLEIFSSEGIAEYDQPSWQWVPSPVPVPPPVNHDLLAIKSRIEVDSTVRSPVAQLPTPAAMAVFLNPNLGTGPSGQNWNQHGAPTANQNALTQTTSNSSARTAEPDMLSRQKKHACTMCHKRFDRPSTLKKHLLVHTGEKAFVCDTCGRRFGVASNLNRHVRKCILKPVNTPPSSAKSSSGSPPASDASPAKLADVLSDTHLPMNTRSDPNSQLSGQSRGGIARGSNDASPSKSSHCVPQTNSAAMRADARSKPSGYKRRRRAPSPSQWIPCSLLSFNLTSEHFYKSAALPSPPVRRNLPYEERDSWDENMSTQPYHPRGWKGVLPGPGLGLGLGLGGRDVRNLNLGENGGFVLGRVMVV